MTCIPFVQIVAYIEYIIAKEEPQKKIKDRIDYCQASKPIEEEVIIVIIVIIVDFLNFRFNLVVCLPHRDVSYNNFTWETTAPIECPRGSV